MTCAQKALTIMYVAIAQDSNLGQEKCRDVSLMSPRRRYDGFIVSVLKTNLSDCQGAIRSFKLAKELFLSLGCGLYTGLLNYYFALCKKLGE